MFSCYKISNSFINCVSITRHVHVCVCVCVDLCVHACMHACVCECMSVGVCMVSEVAMKSILTQQLLLPDFSSGVGL